MPPVRDQLEFTGILPKFYRVLPGPLIVSVGYGISLPAEKNRLQPYNQGEPKTGSQNLVDLEFACLDE